MTGHPNQQTLALLAGGDLDSVAAVEVFLHIDGCAECRQTLTQFEGVQALLRSAFAEPAEGDLRRVRLGVVRSLQNRRRTIRWSWSVASTFAIFVLVFFSLTHRDSPRPAVVEQMVQLPPVHVPMHLALEIPDVKSPRRPQRRPARNGGDAGLRAVNLISRADGSMELRLTTADPNVVILLPPIERTIEQ